MTIPSPTPGQQDEIVERLKKCADDLECNAINLKADSLLGEPNTDLYHRIADEHLRYFLATPPGRWVPLEPTGFRLSRQRR